MSDINLTVTDVIQAAQAQSPSDFQSAFNSLMMDKIAAAIEVKRTEVAQNYFNTDNETSEEQPEDQSNENTEATA